LDFFFELILQGYTKERAEEVIKKLSHAFDGNVVFGY